jgi:hypothetical protein
MLAAARQQQQRSNHWQQQRRQHQWGVPEMPGVDTASARVRMYPFSQASERGKISCSSVSLMLGCAHVLGARLTDTTISDDGAALRRLIGDGVALDAVARDCLIARDMLLRTLYATTTGIARDLLGDGEDARNDVAQILLSAQPNGAVSQCTDARGSVVGAAEFFDARPDADLSSVSELVAQCADMLARTTLARHMDGSRAREHDHTSVVRHARATGVNVYFLEVGDVCAVMRQLELVPRAPSGAGAIDFSGGLVDGCNVVLDDARVRDTKTLLCLAHVNKLMGTLAPVALMERFEQVVVSTPGALASTASVYNIMHNMGMPRLLFLAFSQGYETLLEIMRIATLPGAEASRIVAAEARASAGVDDATIVPRAETALLEACRFDLIVLSRILLGRAERYSAPLRTGAVYERAADAPHTAYDMSGVPTMRASKGTGVEYLDINVLPSGHMPPLSLREFIDVLDHDDVCRSAVLSDGAHSVSVHRSAGPRYAVIDTLARGNTTSVVTCEEKRDAMRAVRDIYPKTANGIAHLQATFVTKAVDDQE